MKSKSSAALFAFFLGAVGGHKFYLRQTGWGIVYFLFFWTLIPGIAALIECIILISMSEETFNTKYNDGKQGYEKISNVEKLEKLAALRQGNMISDQEYEQQKQQLLRKI